MVILSDFSREGAVLRVRETNGNFCSTSAGDWKDSSSLGSIMVVSNVLARSLLSSLELKHSVGEIELRRGTGEGT